MIITSPFSQYTAIAVSASSAATSSFLNNVGVPINTASLALNISGSAGANGSNAVIVGATGPQGDQGDPAANGLSIYLLAVARSTCGGCGPGTIPSASVDTCDPGFTYNPNTGCCYPTS